MSSKKGRKTPRIIPQNGLTTKLREVIRERGLTAYAVARDANVDVRSVQRFLDGERDIRLETADQIASSLGLKLVEAGSKRGRARVAPGAPAEESSGPLALD